MPTQRAGSYPNVSRGWPRRSAALLALLMLGVSCASDMSAELPERAHEQQFQGTAAEAEDDVEERVLAVLPTNFPATRISQEQFTKALVDLVKDLPLPVKETLRSLPGSDRRIVLTSGSATGAAWQTPLAQDYGRFCAQRGTPGDCLDRFDDGPELDNDDKRAIALALAIGPALDAADAEIRAMISPTRLLTLVSLSITGYMALLVVPEPISKGVAAVATVLLWGYLGWELWDLIRAYIRLSEESAQATRFDQLREAGHRFASTIGPNSVRIIVLVGTAAVGGTLSLASKAPKLPGFGQVARTAEAAGGVRAATAAASAERVIISASEGSVRAVLPRNAMAMSSEGSQATARAGALLSKTYRAFKSFRAFKRAMGSAGEGKSWHHLVEQHAGNLKRFGAEALHNTENVIKVETEVHTQISAFYSSKQRDTGFQTTGHWIHGRARVAPHAVLRAAKSLWPESPTRFRGHPMRKSQLKTASTEQLVEEFRKLSAEHGHALEAANARAANRRFDTLVAILQELRSRDPEAQPQLLHLLADPEPSTRSWTATAVLDFAPSEAEQVLEELVRTQIGIPRFSARRMLEQWREGTFNPPWVLLRNGK